MSIVIFKGAMLIWSTGMHIDPSSTGGLPKAVHLLCIINIDPCLRNLTWYPVAPSIVLFSADVGDYFASRDWSLVVYIVFCLASS